MKLKIIVLATISLVSIGNCDRVFAQNLTAPSEDIPDYSKVEIDPEFDLGGLTNSIKDSIIGFVLDNLGAETFLTELNQDLSALTGDITTFLSIRGKEADSGRLGIPNVQQAKQIFLEDAELGELNDVLSGQTGTTYANREKLYQQYLRSLSQEYSENSALSLEGQSKLEAKVDSAISSAKQSLYIAEDSSGQDISQNIMRNISNQLALDQQVNAMAIADMQDAKIDRSLSLQLSSEALTELSKQNMARERQQAAANAAAGQSLFLISIPGKKD